MSRLPYARAAIVACSSAALVLGGVTPALAASDPTTPATFARVNVDTKVAGAAFSVAADVFGSGKKDLVVTGYGTFVGAGPSSTPPDGGTVSIYRQGADLQHWTKVPVVAASESITIPNQPTVTDVNGDGDQDIIVPAGYFFDSFEPAGPGSGKARGSLTWWENNGAANAFTRHDVVTGSPWSYHGAQFVDLDGDGVKDILSTGEQPKNPSDLGDDIVAMHYFKGAIDGLTGERTFAPAVTLAPTGGSLPVVHDVDKDGNLDIITARYFGSGPSFLWLERVGDPTDGALTSANFVSHAISYDQGPAFQIKLVPNLRGDGVDRWVGTNHKTHPAPGPDGGVFELTPGDDIKLQWTPTTLAGPINPRPSPGQGAPGVFGSGDIDGDGDADLAVSGDGDRRLFWIEQTGTGAFSTHVLEDYDATTTTQLGMGQAGGAIVADLDGDGRNELAFSSFDQNTVAIYVRQGGSPVSVASKLSVRGASSVAVGKKATYTVELRGATGPARTATATFTPARTGKPVNVGNVALAATATAGTYRGSVAITSKESGTLRVSYAGRTATAGPSDTASSAAKGVTTVSAITGFATTKKSLSKKKTVKDTVTVSPGFGRTVKLQRWSCSPTKPSCAWKTVKTYKANSKNQVTVSITAPKGTSFWRTSVAATKSGSAAASASRTFKRK